MVLPFLALFVGLALWPLYRNRGLKISKREEKRRIRAADFYGFFTVRGNLSQIGFLMLYYASTVGILSMTRPWLVDLGYSMKEIGFMSGILVSVLSGHVAEQLGHRWFFAFATVVACLGAGYVFLVFRRK